MAGRRRVSPVGVAMETLAVEELVPGVTTPPTRQASGSERRRSFTRLFANDGTLRIPLQQTQDDGEDLFVEGIDVLFVS